MSISDHPLERIPKGPLQEIFSYLGPKDLANVCLLKKSDYTSGITTTNEVWKEIAKKIECPIIRNNDQTLNPGQIRSQVKKYVLDIKQEIKSLKESLPEDIAKIVNSNTAPTFEEIQLLKDYRKARDTLIVWGKIVNKIDQLALPTIVWGRQIYMTQSSFKPGNFKTSTEMFKYVNKFTDWCDLNQNSLNQLPELYLCHLNLITLPSQIKHLTQLHFLLLGNNKLTVLPLEIGNLAQLTLLSLTNNKLISLPKEFENLTQLTLLHLANNNLTSLPKEFENLTQLGKLSLSNNELTILPPEIGKLAQLNELFLQHNKLTELPEEIGNLHQLEVLNLEQNKLITLPEGIVNLTKLESLKLDHNKLTALPKGIRNLPQLKALSAGGNPIALSDRSFVLIKAVKRTVNGCLLPVLKITAVVVLFTWLSIFTREIAIKNGYGGYV